MEGGGGGEATWGEEDNEEGTPTKNQWDHFIALIGCDSTV
jgi:hypothetical protein